LKGGNLKMSDRIVVILLIVAIVFSVLSVVFTLSFDMANSVVTNTIVKENDVSSANVGLVIQETPLNKNG